MPVPTLQLRNEGFVRPARVTAVAAGSGPASEVPVVDLESGPRYSRKLSGGLGSTVCSSWSHGLSWENRVGTGRVCVSGFGVSLTGYPGVKAQGEDSGRAWGYLGSGHAIGPGPPARQTTPAQPSQQGTARQPPAMLPASPSAIHLPAPRPMPSVHSLGQRMPTWPGGAWETEAFLRVSRNWAVEV